MSRLGAVAIWLILAALLTIGCGDTVTIKGPVAPEPQDEEPHDGVLFAPPTGSDDTGIAGPDEVVTAPLQDTVEDGTGDLLETFDVALVPDILDIQLDIPPELPPQICTPGQVACEGNTALTCQADGLAWGELDCAEQFCVQGACAPCLPGTRMCEGDQIMECALDGSTWTAVESCNFADTGTVCKDGNCLSPCEINDNPTAGDLTNVGCEYWAVDMHQNSEFNGPDSPFAIVVSNTHDTLTASVSVGNHGGVVTSREVAPNSAEIILLDPQNVTGVQQQKLAWRVTSNLPIVAYQFNPLENVGVYSNDASLLLPTYALGTSYRVMAWPHRSGALASNFLVMGTQEGPTNVTITPSVNTASGGGIASIPAGHSWSTTLEQFDVLNLESAAAYTDLTGSVVTADQPVAVFAGHVCANCPPSTCRNGQCIFDTDAGGCSKDSDCPIIAACDHLEEQLQPIAAWGSTYVVGKTWPRGKAPDFVRILAHTDGTEVALKPAVATVPTLKAGETFDFETLQDIVVEASNPVLVGQFLEGQNAPGHEHESCDSVLFGKKCGGLFGKSCDDDSDCSPDDANIGDPAFIVGVPAEQFRTEYVFLVPTKYASNYVTIVAPIGTTVSLDGAPANLTFVPVADSGFATARTPLSEGSHILSADQPVGLTVYGWDNYVSYGYPGGMGLESL